MTDLHRIKVTSPQGIAALTHIELDGRELRGVTRLSIEVGVFEPTRAQVIIRLAAHVEFEGDVAIIDARPDAAAITERVETEWYNGNVDEATRDRILGDVDGAG